MASSDRGRRSLHWVTYQGPAPGASRFNIASHSLERTAKPLRGSVAGAKIVDPGSARRLGDLLINPRGFAILVDRRRRQERRAALDLRIDPLEDVVDLDPPRSQRLSAN